MHKKLILVLGGARSGKSDYAQNIVADLAKPVVYVATAQAHDEEMRIRIQQHRSGRPRDWQTLEAPRQTAAAILTFARDAEVILLDCITLLASNVISTLPEPYTDAQSQAILDEEVNELLAAYQKMNALWVLVSNEVGLGLVPPYPLGRVYRDVLGRANQRLAQAADEVIFMVAGLPMRIK